MFHFLPQRQALQRTLLDALKISLILLRHSTASKMTNHSEEQQNSRLSRSRASVCFLIAALGYILIATSLVLFTFAIFVLFTENSNLAIRNATTATVMLIFGIILVLLARINFCRPSCNIYDSCGRFDKISGPYTFVLPYSSPSAIRWGLFVRFAGLFYCCPGFK